MSHLTVVLAIVLCLSTFSQVNGYMARKKTGHSAYQLPKNFVGSHSRVFREVRSQANSLYQLKDLPDELQHGDKCSLRAEKLRTEVYRSILKAEYDTFDMSEELLNELEENVNALVANGEPLCSESHTLACNARTKTCNCGHSVFEALDITTPEFILEGGKCLVGKANACITFDACTTGTACLGTKNGGDCHIAAKEYGEELLAASPKVTFGQWVKGVLDGKICTCQSSSGAPPGPARYKRGLNATADVDLDLDFDHLDFGGQTSNVTLNKNS